MSNFAIYDLANGAIKRRGTCAPRDVRHQARLGEAAIETDGTVRDDTHRIDLSQRPPRVIPL